MRRYARTPACSQAIRFEWLGRRLERARLDHNWSTAIATERALCQLADSPDCEVWPRMWVVRGQNNVRRRRRLETLNA